MDPKNTDKPVQPDAKESKVVPPPSTSPDAPAAVATEVPESPTTTPATPTAPVQKPESVAEEIPTATPPASTEVPSVSTTPDTTSPADTDYGYTETKSNKLLYIFVFVLVVVLLSLVGLFFYKQFTSTTADQPSQEVSPTVAVSPVEKPATEEQAELDQIEIPNLDQELQDISKDIEQL